MLPSLSVIITASISFHLDLWRLISSRSPQQGGEPDTQERETLSMPAAPGASWCGGSQSREAVGEPLAFVGRKGRKKRVPCFTLANTRGERADWHRAGLDWPLIPEEASHEWRLPAG
jgi:hypothetical protein